MNSTGLSRRSVLAGGLGLGAVLAAGGRTSHAEPNTVIRWWDPFTPLEPLHSSIWRRYESQHPDVRVEYTKMSSAEIIKALQLAFRSKQLPDVFATNNDRAGASKLYKAGWFSPLSETFKINQPVVKESLFPGLHIFGGKLHTFPTFTARQHQTCLWYHKKAMQDAGFDLSGGGTLTWDQMRQAARKMTKGGAYGLVLPLQNANRITNHMNDLAEVAGASSPYDWKTGDFAYASAPFVEAIEFLNSFQKDGTLHPASFSLSDTQARARWAAGETGMFLDGIYAIGIVSLDTPEVAGNIDGAGIPLPAPGNPGFTYEPPRNGTFWVSSQTQHPDVASDILQSWVSDEIYKGMVTAMSQLPLDLSVVATTDAHPAYKKLAAIHAVTAKIAPEPMIRNAEVAEVYGEMKAITPTLADILNGVIAGAIPNVRQALQTFNDQMMKERDRAIATVVRNGSKVSQDDWVFADWKHGDDFTPGRYKQ